MPKHLLNDEIFDVVLKHAINEYMDDDFLSDMDKYADLPDPVYSKKFNNNIAKAHRKAVFIERRKPVINALQKVAIIVLSFVTLSAVLMVSVEAIRMRVFNLFLKEKSDHIELYIGDELNSNSELNLSMYIPHYLPENFFLATIENTTRFTRIEFIDNNGKNITFSALKEEDNKMLENIENKESEEIILDHGTGYFVQSTDSTYNYLVWNIDNYSFRLSSELSEEEMIRIANSVKFKNPLS